MKLRVRAFYRKRRPMAALNPEKSLQDEATCPVCLDYFQSPMMIIDCGHNFCQGCISQCCEGSSTESFSCPTCRKPFLWENLRPNRHLWNIVELTKQLSMQRANEAGKQKLCVKHQEPLKLYCERDQISICVVCERSKLHKNHSVIPIEEAVQLYQEKIDCCLQSLKEERGKLLSSKSDSAKISEAVLSKTKDEKQKLVGEFQKLHQILENEEQRLLVQLAELEAEVKKKTEEQANKFSAEISHLNILISELEQKYQETPVGMLQDIGSTLDRCQRDEFEPHTLIDNLELMKRFEEFFNDSDSLHKGLRKFRDILTEPKWIKEDVMLDPMTACPRFVVSEDFKSVMWGPVREKLPYNARRFDPSRCVLGAQGFSSGKHCWSVGVGRGTSWAVGVARESVKRKGRLNMAPEEGIWAMGLYNGQYKVLTSPSRILNQSKHVRKIQIYLDCEKKTVAFFDAEEKNCLVHFLSLSFEPEKIYPFFRVGDINTILCLC